ncbi:hypothetical protein B9H02_10875 [Prosthecochloris sp. HL-130-GSB]|jgi:hypothetical protein|nr:hypothetical protein B9H02_10875 [Prosthecochloris sp. HL-130-GSB]
MSHDNGVLFLCSVNATGLKTTKIQLRRKNKTDGRTNYYGMATGALHPRKNQKKDKIRQNISCWKEQ